MRRRGVLYDRVLSFGRDKDESDPDAIVGELRRLRGELEGMPKGRGKMAFALLALSDELDESGRALRRWAKEHDAQVRAVLDGLGARSTNEDGNS